MLTFDALIGNTDRHQENWGLVWSLRIGNLVHAELTPAFDNGTSLGHELQPKHFREFAQAPDRMQRYISRGHHHLRWRIDDPQSCGHQEMLLKLLEHAPELRTTMLSVLQFKPEALENAILPLTALDLPTPLSPERAGFILALVQARREYLLAALVSLSP